MGTPARLAGSTGFTWEAEALDSARHGLDDFEPYRAWSNLELLGSDGSMNEVDLLVIAPRGILLVEIKSGGGRLDGDAGAWTWTRERRPVSVDNPLFLANRKAERLKDLLSRQKALPDPTDGRRPPVDAALSRALARAVDEAGIRPSRRILRVGDYDLERVLREGPGFQDRVGENRTMKTKRRIRIYAVPTGGLLTRETVQRAASSSSCRTSSTPRRVSTSRSPRARVVSATFLSGRSNVSGSRRRSGAIVRWTTERSRGFLAGDYQLNPLACAHR